MDFITRSTKEEQLRRLIMKEVMQNPGCIERFLTNAIGSLKNKDLVREIDLWSDQ